MVLGREVSNKKYPQIGKVEPKKIQGLCLFCGQPKADSSMEIQWDIFRGNDSVIKVHRECAKGATVESVTALMPERKLGPDAADRLEAQLKRIEAKHKKNQQAADQLSARLKRIEAKHALNVKGQDDVEWEV